jgi:hypothetical protein
MIKTCFKFLLCVAIYSLVYIAAGAIMPYSQGFKEFGAGASDNSFVLLFMLINSAWICFTMYFIVKNTHLPRRRLFFYIVFVLFFVNSFMMQIETLLFSGAFPVLTKLDIILIMITSIFPLLATTPLIIKFFQNKEAVAGENDIDKKSLIIKLGIIGIVYPCLYYLFGYFVVMRLFFDAAQPFYAETIAGITGVNFSFFPIQIIRGILFGIFVLPLKSMFDNKTTFIASVCFVYLCTAVQLIVPNSLMPDLVRLAHLIEISSSMLLFGIIVGNILWRRRVKQLESGNAG